MVAAAPVAAAVHGSGSGSAGNRTSAQRSAGGGGGGAAAAAAAGDQPFIMLVSKSPLPPFNIPYPQPPPETPVSELRRAILDIYLPSKSDQLAVTYAEQLRLSTLTSWRLGMLVLDLHQNALIDPETRESAVQQVGYRLEDDHQCALIEDGDEIHISLKDGCAVSELQLPKLSPSHIYTAPANVVSLTRKGTLSQPPPYSLLAPAEPSSHSSSVAGQPTANYHSHNYASDWRSPFRVVTAANVGTGVVRREFSGANGAVSPKPGPATTGSVLRNMPRGVSSSGNQARRAGRRAAPSPNAADMADTRHHPGQSRLSTPTGEANPPPTYSAGHEVLNLPPTARVIGSGVQGTAGNGRKRSGSRQNSSSGGNVLGGAVLGGTSTLVPLLANTGLSGAGPDSTPMQPSPGWGTSEPDTYVLRSRDGTHSKAEVRESAGPSRAANGAGTRRSSGASREAKATLNGASGARPHFVKHSSSGYQSHLSAASQGIAATASATTAFVNSPTSVTVPPIVNLSPFPEQAASSTPSASNPSSAEVSAAMLQHLRRARSSFAGPALGEAAEPGVESTVGTNGVGAPVLVEEALDSSAPRSEESDTEEDAPARSKNLATRRKSKSKDKGKGKASAAAAPIDREAIESAAQRADKRYRDVRATLEREIAKQAAADGARAAHIAEESTRKEEERRKREDEERRQAVRDKWELWEEVKKREKREMKERKKRGEDVPVEAMLGPTGAVV